MSSLNPSALPGDLNAAFLALVDPDGTTPPPDPEPGGGVTIEQIEALLAPLIADVATLTAKVNQLTPGPIPAESALFIPRLLDEEGVGIASATIEILQGSTRVAIGTTNVSGRPAFSTGVGFVLLKGITYSMRVYASGYLAQAPMVVQLADDASPDYELEAVPPFPVSSDPAKAVVRVRTADFVGVPLPNTKVTITLVDTKVPVIGDIIRSTRFVEGMTNKIGEVDLEVYSDVTLIDAKLKPTYKVTFTGVELKIRVPHQGGLASRLQDPLG